LLISRTRKGHSFRAAINAETTPSDSEEQSTCHMRVTGYEASWGPCVQRVGFIGKARKMAAYLHVCGVALRLLSPARGGEHAYVVSR